MENMIKKIVDADNEAKAMEKDTLEEKEELSKTIEAETKKIYDDFMAKAEEVVKRNDIQETKKAEQQWEEIQGKHNSVHIKLDSDFKLNCDKFACVPECRRNYVVSQKQYALLQNSDGCQ